MFRNLIVTALVATLMGMFVLILEAIRPGSSQPPGMNPGGQGATAVSSGGQDPASSDPNQPPGGRTASNQAQSMSSGGAAQMPLPPSQGQGPSSGMQGGMMGMCGRMMRMMMGGMNQTAAEKTRSDNRADGSSADSPSPPRSMSPGQ